MRGPAHADDILYLGGAFDKEAESHPQEKKVSDLMQQYWVNFATNLNPNGDGLPQWPAFTPDPSAKSVMQFGNGEATLIPVPNQKIISLIEQFFDWMYSQKTMKTETP